jgi:hypothetical protein
VHTPRRNLGFCGIMIDYRPSTLAHARVIGPRRAGG